MQGHVGDLDNLLIINNSRFFYNKHGMDLGNREV